MQSFYKKLKQKVDKTLLKKALLLLALPLIPSFFFYKLGFSLGQKAGINASIVEVPLSMVRYRLSELDIQERIDTNYQKPSTEKASDLSALSISENSISENVSEKSQANFQAQNNDIYLNKELTPDKNPADKAPDRENIIVASEALEDAISSETKSTSSDLRKNGGWYLQMGTFRDRKQAENLLKSLSEASVKSEIDSMKAAGEDLFRVLCGPYTTRKDAEDSGVEIEKKTEGKRKPFVTFVSG